MPISAPSGTDDHRGVCNFFSLPSAGARVIESRPKTDVASFQPHVAQPDHQRRIELALDSDCRPRCSSKKKSLALRQKLNTPVARTQSCAVATRPRESGPFVQPQIGPSFVPKIIGGSSGLRRPEITSIVDGYPFRLSFSNRGMNVFRIDGPTPRPIDSPRPNLISALEFRFPDRVESDLRAATSMMVHITIVRDRESSSRAAPGHKSFKSGC